MLFERPRSQILIKLSSVKITFSPTWIGTWFVTNVVTPKLLKFNLWQCQRTTIQMFLWIWYPNVSDLWLLLYCHHQANVSTCGKISFGASVLPDEPFHFKRKEKKGSKIEEADGENVERTGGIEREESEALVDWQTQKKRAENSPGRHFHIQEAAEWNLFHTHTHTLLPNIQAPMHSPTQSGKQALKDQLMHTHIHGPFPADESMASDWTQVVWFTSTSRQHTCMYYAQKHTHTLKHSRPVLEALRCMGRFIFAGLFLWPIASPPPRSFFRSSHHPLFLCQFGCHFKKASYLSYVFFFFHSLCAVSLG